MIRTNKAWWSRALTVIAVAPCLLVHSSGCSERPPLVPRALDSTLVVGLGVGDVGVQQAVRNIAVEGLVDFDQNARPRPWLAESWAPLSDGRGWRIRLRPDATFHDGQPVTASIVRDILRAKLPGYLREPYEDVEEISASSDLDLDIRLKRPSAFILEGLEIPIQREGESVIGTGPFRSVTDGAADMLAYKRYYGGPPAISRLEIRPYPSLRTAWAEMLRKHVDVLYEVGVDALDSLGKSSAINVFTFERPYVFTLVLNSRRGPFQDRNVRRALNHAIDRQLLIRTVLDGHGIPADGPVSPSHWARDSRSGGFEYAPEGLTVGGNPLRSTCIFGDPSLERMALEVQRQLEEVGVVLTLEAVNGAELLQRLDAGNFECALADIISGPNLLRPYWFWHSDGPFNWGRFKSVQIDQALDGIRHGSSDDDYRRAVSAFQQAILNDPPAIFLAWSERARAVSKRFEVPVEPGRDILSTLRSWRPTTDR
jgi:peptide/nickel transport system substrate-binding protein